MNKEKRGNNEMYQCLLHYLVHTTSNSKVVFHYLYWLVIKVGYIIVYNFGVGIKRW